MKKDSLWHNKTLISVCVGEAILMLGLGFLSPICIPTKLWADHGIIPHCERCWLCNRPHPCITQTF